MEEEAGSMKTSAPISPDLIVLLTEQEDGLEGKTRTTEWKAGEP
jgi:hypothetical protein